MRDDEGHEPTIDEVERELRLTRAEELRARVAEREAVRTAPGTAPAPASRESLPSEVDDPASPLPYLAATGVTALSLVGGIALLGFPAALATQLGLTFLGLAMIFKRMEDVPPDHPSALLRWASDRVDALGEKFGIELYGLMALTTFLRAEALSLSSSAVSLAEILASPVAGIIQWFVMELIESIMNAVWAALWWMPLFSNLGWPLAVAVIAAAWAVLWVLDMPVREEDYGMGEIEDTLASVERDLEDLGSLGGDVR